MTLHTLDDIAVGQLVWSAAQGPDDTAQRGGLVVDVDLSGDAPALVVLDERANKLWVQSRPAGAKVWHAHRPARLVRLRPEEIGTVDVYQGPARLHGWARRSLLTAALGMTGNGRYIGEMEIEHINAALRLRERSGVLG